jgi:ribosomal protein S18 acetylase RimI-like enzyme
MEELMLYRVQKGDITQAGKVLADAFKCDPLWNKIFEGEFDLEKRFRAMAEASVKQGLRYGEVYAPSESLEGVVAWVPGKYADMTIWQTICSGNMGTVMRMGLNALKRMGPALKPIIKYRHEHMAGSAYLYLLIVGVSTELRGKGLGRKLIDAVIEKSDQERLPLYLDVQVEENVKMYEHFGCRLLRRITLPMFDIPIWEMVREPQT